LGGKGPPNLGFKNDRSKSEKDSREGGWRLLSIIVRKGRIRRVGVFCSHVDIVRTASARYTVHLMEPPIVPTRAENSQARKVSTRN